MNIDDYVKWYRREVHGVKDEPAELPVSDVLDAETRQQIRLEAERRAWGLLPEEPALVEPPARRKRRRPDFHGLKVIQGGK